MVEAIENAWVNASEDDDEERSDESTGSTNDDVERESDAIFESKTSDFEKFVESYNIGDFHVPEKMPFENTEYEDGKTTTQSSKASEMLFGGNFAFGFEPFQHTESDSKNKNQDVEMLKFNENLKRDDKELNNTSKNGTDIPSQSSKNLETTIGGHLSFGKMKFGLNPLKYKYSESKNKNLGMLKFNENLNITDIELNKTDKTENEKLYTYMGKVKDMGGIQDSNTDDVCCKKEDNTIASTIPEGLAYSESVVDDNKVNSDQNETSYSSDDRSTDSDTEDDIDNRDELSVIFTKLCSDFSKNIPKDIAYLHEKRNQSYLTTNFLSNMFENREARHKFSVESRVQIQKTHSEILNNITEAMYTLKNIKHSSERLVMIPFLRKAKEELGRTSDNILEKPHRRTYSNLFFIGIICSFAIGNVYLTLYQ